MALACSGARGPLKFRSQECLAERELLSRSGKGGAYLVSHVKEGEQLLVLHELGDLLPLLRCGVDTFNYQKASLHYRGWMQCAHLLPQHAES